MRKLLVLNLLLVAFCVTGQQLNGNKVQDILDNLTGDPDWLSIHQHLVPDYGIEKSDSIVLAVKVEFYWQKHDYKQYLKVFLKFAEETGLLDDPHNKNAVAWRVFSYATERELLEQAKSWILEAINDRPSNPYFLDTYANILYKLGDVKQALYVEDRAVWIGNLEPVFVKNLFCMKAGIPTWKHPKEMRSKSKETSRDHIWSSVRRELVRKADSLIWAARLEELRSSPDSSEYATRLIAYIEEFKPIRNASSLNEDAWAVFQFSNSKAELKKALSWSTESLKGKSIDDIQYAYLDTSANLLYKLGDKKEAINLEEKAVALCPEVDKPAYRATLDKIRKGEKTWGN